MRAACKTNYPQLDGILNEGDIVDLEPEKDLGGNYYTGHYSFISKNGKKYTDKDITALIGNKTLPDIFERLQ